MINSREDLLKVRPIVKVIDIPSWSEQVRISALSMKNKMKAAQLIDDKDEFGNEKIIAMSLCDETGKHLFTEADYELFVELPAVGIESLVVEIFKLNSQAEEELKKDSAENQKS